MQQTAKAQGFTLIELLVTILILAVLIALLAAGVPRFIASAQAIKCVSNLSQISAAARQWSSDNNQRIVPVYAPTESPPLGLYNWTGQLAPYLGRSSTEGFSNFSDMPVYICPSSPKRFGYGYNYLYLSWIITEYDIIQWVNYSQIDKPSQVVMLMDNCNPSNNASWRPFVRTPGYIAGGTKDIVPYFVHPGKKANVLWVDGHVSSENSETLMTGNKYWNPNFKE